MPDVSQTVQDWYTQQLQKYYAQRYRAYLRNREPKSRYNELGRSATKVDRAEHDQLPEEVRAAFAFYWQHFEETDLGGVGVYRFSVRRKVYFAIRVTTDGDDGYLEVYDKDGAFVAASRRYIEVTTWGSQEWLREQAIPPWKLPPELYDAPQRTLWGKQDGSTREEQPPPPPAPSQPAMVPWEAEVRYTSGQVFPQKILLTEVTIVTGDGPVTVPVADIQQIDFAPRPPDGSKKRSKQATPQDTLITVDGQWTGTIQGDPWQAYYPDYTTNLTFADLKRIVKRFTLEKDAGAFGTQREFRLRGRTDGFLCGTDRYSLISCVATAAVHAGLVQEGQTGTVKVETVPSPPQFEGSTRNGVASEAFELPDEGGAFRFV